GGGRRAGGILHVANDERGGVAARIDVGVRDGRRGLGDRRRAVAEIEGVAGDSVAGIGIGGAGAAEGDVERRVARGRRRGQRRDGRLVRTLADGDADVGRGGASVAVADGVTERVAAEVVRGRRIRDVRAVVRRR